MDDDQRLKKKKHFTEEFGLMLENMGLPRMAGRILGWLLVCEPPYQSMNELAEALSASKASISNSTRLLIEVGLIERISLPDYRYDHYQVRPDAWFQMTRRRAAQVGNLRRLAERGLTLLEGEEPGLRERLEEMRETYAFFEREFPAFLDRWAESRVGRERWRGLATTSGE